MSIDPVPAHVCKSPEPSSSVTVATKPGPVVTPHVEATDKLIASRFQSVLQVAKCRIGFKVSFFEVRTMEVTSPETKGVNATLAQVRSELAKKEQKLGFYEQHARELIDDIKVCCPSFH